MQSTQTHDTEIFTAMVNMLIASGRGEKDYGFKKDRLQTRYEEVASVLNQNGFTNRAGEPLNRNALKQVVHRVRRKPEILDELCPDWDDFEVTELSITQEPERCVVCNNRPVRKNKKTCSSECGADYQRFRDVPHDPRFPSIFHELRYREQFAKKSN